MGPLLDDRSNQCRGDQKSNLAPHRRHIEELLHGRTRLLGERKHLLGDTRNQVERGLERDSQRDGQEEEPTVGPPKTEDLRKRAFFLVDEHEEEQRPHEAEGLAERSAHRIEERRWPHRQEHHRNDIEGEERPDRPQGRDEEGHGRGEGR